ncbi:hypothetical protein QBC32DRAFT_25494 [Pseudoneurospora amorphoporcata]|uniref:Uncharacterized protein n=1 Tax=Pseudoneurospora amorphoporcata TaxID=241081 RepID=A0AAN6NUB0_9PEZI|nr:hypothetical protein QBC32DRAFT_25494 [Pseudoneurospora amorphoporcata]
MMLAAEVAKDRSDDATHVTSEAEPAIRIDAPDAQNAPLDQPQVTGETASPATEEIENKHISDIANEAVTSAEVSVSGGSDNEAAKSKDDKPRTSSTVKKPIAFKAINVNQKFLTTKATAPAAAPAKVAEKPAASTATLSSALGSLTARPRLIAKTGSGSVKSAMGANGKTGSAPDPNAVWNKNRPVPPPEPKKYTDEELKKYGIHMASRLQPEDTRGQANWADIDDDDEDWAPETITWKDGTKIAIPLAEEHSPSAPAPEPEPVPKPVEIVKETVATEKPKSPAPGYASVIKPGVLGSGKGLILKGAAEKLTLVAKPPAQPAPVKSPWAPIPKVEKVSPMVAEPLPPSHHAPRYPQRDGPTQYSGFPPPGPPGPKEIAADDFSRGPWRDGSGGGGNRELYNSHSGRYEPVQERRGSMRPEPQYGRQPSVLQRPAHNDHHGPAEPSAAFQTHRTSDQHVPYGRRRGSSNVSGVSSGYLNRAKGFEQPLHPPEIINARRESMTAGSDGPGSPRNFSPSGLQYGPRHPHPHNQGWPPRVSPAVAHAAPVPHHHVADMVGVPPVGPPHVQEQVPLVTDQEIELQKRLMREKVEAARKRRMEEEEREKAAREERIRLKLQALGPAPESNSAKKAAAKEHPASTTDGAPQAGTSDEQKPTEKAEVKTPTTTQPEKVEQQPDGVPSQILPDSEPLDNRQQPLWSSSAKQQGRYTATWGSQTSTTKNVWGPPSNNRTLGNGTFNPDLGTSPPPPVSNKPPGPIAPPSRNTMGPRTNLFPDGAPARLPPIAPPTHSSAPAAPLSESERQAKANQWVSAARLNDQAFEAMLKDRFAEQDRRRAEKGLTVEDIQPAVKDVWRPTKLDENGMRVEAGPRQTVRVGKENPWVAGQASQQTQAPAANTAILANAGAAPRTSSRFFPSRQQTMAAAEYQRPHSPSPPPPDTETTGHPAFDGDVKNPHVCIPTPRPQVRLPPPSQAREEAKVENYEAPKPQGPSFSWANTVAYKGEERAPATTPGSPWQARIDSLLGARKPSHSQQKPAPGVDSTSRAAYEHPEATVTVSLTAAMMAEASPTTKDMDEDCFEEQEMGSLPTVRIPTELPEMAWAPTHAPAPKPLHRKLFPLTTSAEPIRIDTSSNGIGSVIRIAFPGTDRHPPFVTAVTIPFSRTRSNPRRGGGAPRGGRLPNAPHGQRGMPGGRGSGRDASSPNDQGPSGPPTGPHGSHQQARGRGGYRGRDSAWSRSAPTAIQTS